MLKITILKGQNHQTQRVLILVFEMEFVGYFWESMVMSIYGSYEYYI